MNTDSAYLYLTIEGHVWIEEMLSGWISSGKRYFCFPWVRFNVNTLPASKFWLYVYYSKTKTQLRSLAGKIKYRVHVAEWQRATKFAGADVHCVRADEDGKVWFKCDECQEIVIADGLLSLDHLKHRDGKALKSTIRNSIPPVILANPSDVRVLRTLKPQART